MQANLMHLTDLINTLLIHNKVRNPRAFRKFVLFLIRVKSSHMLPIKLSVLAWVNFSDCVQLRELHELILGAECLWDRGKVRQSFSPICVGSTASQWMKPQG